MSHPIHDFPPELLAEILLHTFQEVSFHRYQSSLAGGPVAASAVCSYWRRVALAYPNLWSNIRVTIAHPDDSSAIVEAIEARIARAGAHALSVEYLEMGEPGGCPALDALLTHSRRWEKATLTLTYTPLVRLVPLHNEIPLLRTASVSALLIATSEMGETPEMQYIFSNAPLLSSFAFSASNGEAVAELPFVLPWQQLIRYEGPLFTAADPPRYARHLLKHAQVLSVTDVTSFASPTGRTELPALRVLSANAQALAGLRAPALVELRVRGSCDSTDVLYLRGFLVWSRCTLRTLFMYAVLLESDGDALVDVCREVEDLICTLGTESTVWLGLLPRLRKLTVLVVAEGVRGAASNFIRSCALADILRARSVNQPELVKINLWFSEDCYEAVDRNALYELVCLGSECGVRVQYDVFTCEHEELMDTWMTV